MDWIICALERRKANIERISRCSSPHCICSPDFTGDRQPADCHCYDKKHAMIELAKANAQFAEEIKEVLRCSGSDSSVVF